MFALPGSIPAQGSVQGLAIARVAGLALLLVVLGIGLLYAYRSQTPSVPQVDLAQAIQNINTGRVRAVTVSGSAATLEFRDSPSHRERTTVPQPDNVLAPAVARYNAANPSQAVELRFAQDTQPVGLIVPIVLSLVPVFLIGGFFYYLMGARRGR
jgi:ATP-dependent Zn protease